MEAIARRRGGLARLLLVEKPLIDTRPRDNKWRDPVAWNLYRIDQDTGDWKEIPLGYLNKSSISQGRKCAYPLRNVYKHTGMGQKAKDMEAIIEETKKKMENEEIALALP
eukprot:1333581-Amorphochlora_amoeboformis.AAC.1